MRISMDFDRAGTGRKGEDIACEFLIENGHTILERNWRYGHLEIDIISYDKDGLHFVEVKTRRPPLQARPQDSVSIAKQKRITTAAQKYLMCSKAKEIGEPECRFDVIAFVIDGKKTSIEYIPDAYYPVFV